MRVVERAHSRTTALLLLTLVLAGTGGWAAMHLPSSIFPAVTFPIVKVIADVGEEPAARMIPTVTRPLEEAVDRVPGIRRVLSTTSRGSVEMSAQFAWGTDMAVALQRVQGQIARVRPDLPPDARIEAEWMNTSIFPVLGYALTSDQVTQWQLRQLAEYTLKPALVGIQGVARVEVQGGRQREFQVHLQPQALAGRHLTAADVVSALKANNSLYSAGLIERNHELYLTLVDGRATSLADLGDIVISTPAGKPVRLSELGTLEAADAVSYIRTTAQGHEAVLVNIVQQPSANIVAIERGVNALLAAHPDLIPPHVKWTIFYNQARFVSDSVKGTRDAILIGVGLAALVLLVFLRAWRVTAVAVAAIPFTVAIVALGLAANGQTINLMTLGGIAAALGLVADDAIVVVENIHRHRETSRSADPTLSGVQELLPAIAGSSLSTIVVFFPFALLSGITGAFFRPLALTMVLALAVSGFLAAFVVPAAVRRREERAGEGEGEAPTKRSAEGHGTLAHVARRLVRWWPLSVVVLLALYGTGILLYRSIGTDFLPAMDEGSIILDYWTPPGTSLTDTNAMLDQVDAVVQSLPDVESYSRRTGTQLGFFITEPNRGDYVIKLKPRGQRRGVEKVIGVLRERTAEVEPAIHTDFGQLMEDNIGDLTGGVPQPIDVKLFGENQDQLRTKAKEAAAIIGTVQGVEDVFDGITIAGPALDLKARSEALAQRGLTTEDLHAAVQPSTVGTVAGDIRLGERIYDVRVFMGKGEELAHATILGRNGTVTPLTDLADITTGEPEAEIDRQNLQSYLGVTARLSGRSLGGAMADIQRRLKSNLVLPPGMSIEYGGLYAQQQSSFKGLLGVLFVGLALVAVVLLFEFGDWRASLLTALVALAVLAGAFGALILSGQTLNIASFVGAIMMVGIVGENAVFVIHEAQLQLVAGAPVRDAWAGAARRRLRPVAMTILATAFALAPLALALGQGSQLLQPLAIAVIGGFLLSGPLVLVVLPSLYALLDPNGRLAGRPRKDRA